MKKIHESLVKLARDNKKKDKEIERLKSEMKDLVNTYNKTMDKLNILECRYETIVKVIKTLDVKPADADPVNTCPICMVALGVKKVRGIECPSHHSICPAYFVALCVSSDDLSCPLCRRSLEDGDLVIE